MIRAAMVLVAGPERHGEQGPYTAFSRRHVPVDTVYNAVALERGEGPEQSVPHRKHIAVVRIGVRHHVVVVHLVHVR